MIKKNRPLQTLFDKTFTEGKVPVIWKDANVTVLFKNIGDKSETTNYRPVSLTCLPSRICERTVRDKIMNPLRVLAHIVKEIRDRTTLILAPPLPTPGDQD